MALSETIKTESFSVAIWQIDETTEELKRMLNNSAIIEKIEERYGNEKRRREQLISHLLLMHLLGEAKEIKHFPNGAPTIESREDIHISISHSRKSIAVAISTKPIGIDIEEIERNQYKLHKKFTTPKEQEWINNCTQSSQKQLISTIIWSAKEAIYKLANTNGLLFESEIEITPFDTNSETHFIARYRNTPCKCNFLVFSCELLVVSC